MSQLVYFDNSVIRALIDKPEKWDIFYENFVYIFGEHMRPVYSYYLFFEYFDFHKNNFNKPSEKILSTLSGIPDYKQAADQAEKIGMLLDDYHRDAYSSLLDQLYSPKIRKELFHCIQKRVAYESQFQTSMQLKDMLFKDILKLFHCDYQTFAERAAILLTWDFFCDVSAKRSIRKAQLGVWTQLWDKNVLLPFGKIIDDLPDFYLITLSPNTAFKGSEDMVDSEQQIYALIGLISDSGELEPVNIITCDPVKNVKERMQMGSNVILKIEEVRKIKINKRSVKIYCLNKKTFELLEIIDVSIQIFLQDGNSILNDK